MDDDRLDPGNLFRITDQRGKVWYVAAPSVEKAATWLRENGKDGGLVQHAVPVHVRTIGTLRAIVEPNEETGLPRIQEPEESHGHPHR